MKERLFVYGTLMRYSSREMAMQLRQRAVFEGEATYNGRLYLVEDYPGVVPSGDPDEQVFGEVFTTDDAELMRALDRYEECGPDAPQPALYVRRKENVSMPDGAACEAWVYVYNRPVDDLVRIESGRFGDFIRQSP